MGWASGSSICSDVLDVVLPKFKKYQVPEKVTVDVVAKIIDVFERQDCDTTDELYGENEVINKALEKLHPDWYKEVAK